ncbi:exported hypothetical protein [Cupriavidus taiwanensis]|nr:exported hypothetical protein [Cupriavidus taiwanensis]
MTLACGANRLPAALIIPPVCSPLSLAGEGPGERAGAGIPTRFTSWTLRPSPPPLSRARERGAIA